MTIGFLAFLTAELGLFRSFGPVLRLAIGVTLIPGDADPGAQRLSDAAAFWPGRPCW